MDERLQDEVERLTDGRSLNQFDKSAVEAVAGLNLRLVDARKSISAEGMVIDDGKGFPIEHPALLIEKRASAEIRGWVKDRPDLFGQRNSASSASQQSGDSSAKAKFGGFKVVN